MFGPGGVEAWYQRNRGAQQEQSQPESFSGGDLTEEQAPILTEAELAERRQQFLKNLEEFGNKPFMQRSASQPTLEMPIGGDELITPAPPTTFITFPEEQPQTTTFQPLIQLPTGSTTLTPKNLESPIKKMGKAITKALGLDKGKGPATDVGLGTSGTIPPPPVVLPQPLTRTTSTPVRPRGKRSSAPDIKYTKPKK